MHLIGFDHDFQHTGFRGILGVCTSRKLPVFVIIGNVNGNRFGTRNACTCIFGCGVCHEFIHTVRSFKIQRDIRISVCAVIAVADMETDIRGIVVYAVVCRKLAVGHCGAVFIGIFFQAVLKKQTGTGVVLAKCYVGISFCFKLGNYLIFIRRSAV